MDIESNHLAIMQGTNKGETMQKELIDTLGVMFWGLILVLGLAYFGNALAEKINADLTKLQNVLNVNESKQLNQLGK